MSSGSSFEPIEPGGGKLEKSLRSLWPLLWLLLVYLGIAWWRGDPPSWRTVFNVVSVAAAVLALLGWKISPERKLEKRLRQLFQGGRIPDPEQVLEVLEGSGDNHYRALTERYSLGLLTPEDYARQMALLLKLPQPLSGGRAAVILIAIGSVAAG